MSIEKEFVPYQESLELKSIGFDEPCFTFYPKEGKMGFDGKYHSIKEGYRNSTVNDIWIKRYKKDFECVAAPTFSQCFRWFRKKYQTSPSIHCMSEQGNSWRYHIPNEGGERDFNTYEEAEMACLRKLIQIVKEKL